MTYNLFDRGALEAILGLRTRVLRPHFEGGELARFPGDLDASTRHYAARDRGEDVIGCATLMWVNLPELVREAFPGSSEQGWQLRGMAVDPRHQGEGVGGALLDFIERDVLALRQEGEPGEVLVWCNARARATGLYARFGMRELGERFIIEGIGPHVMMARRLGRG